MGKKDVDTGINPRPMPNPRPQSELQINMRLDDAIRENARLTEELESARRNRDEWSERAQHLQEIVDSTRSQLERSFVIDKSASPSLWFVNGGGVPMVGSEPDPFIMRVDELMDSVTVELGRDSSQSIRDRAILRGLLSSAEAQLRLAEFRASWNGGAMTPTVNETPPR